MNGENERPFADLPAALVEEMLIRTEPLSQRMQADFERLRAERHQHRQALEESGILRREGELPAVSVPTTCGVDGAYALERLVATDLVAAAAVAVEGSRHLRRPASGRSHATGFTWMPRRTRRRRAPWPGR